MQLLRLRARETRRALLAALAAASLAASPLPARAQLDPALETGLLAAVQDKAARISKDAAGDPETPCISFRSAAGVNAAQRFQLSSFVMEMSKLHPRSQLRRLYCRGGEAEIFRSLLLPDLSPIAQGAPGTEEMLARIRWLRGFVPDLREHAFFLLPLKQRFDKPDPGSGVNRLGSTLKLVDGDGRMQDYILLHEQPSPLDELRESLTILHEHAHEKHLDCVELTQLMSLETGIPPSYLQDFCMLLAEGYAHDWAVRQMSRILQSGDSRAQAMRASLARDSHRGGSEGLERSAAQDLESWAVDNGPYRQAVTLVRSFPRSAGNDDPDDPVEAILRGDMSPLRATLSSRQSALVQLARLANAYDAYALYYEDAASEGAEVPRDALEKLQIKLDQEITKILNPLSAHSEEDVREMVEKSLSRLPFLPRPFPAPVPRYERIRRR